jgi:Tfp pilus assembly protein PilN
MNQPNVSFLPEDYLRRKSERRALLINMVLFAGMVAVVSSAFMITNRKRAEVLTKQAEVEAEFENEKQKLKQLEVLEAQQRGLRERGEITQLLIERVPRSVLLAEITNRMPGNVSLTQLEMTSKRVMPAAKPVNEPPPAPKSLSDKLGLGEDGDKPKAEPPRPKPPRLEFSLIIEGVAISDTEVADFQSNLKQCPLLERVDLISTVESVTDEVVMRKFRLEASIRPDADVALMKPVEAKRKDAMEAPAKSGKGGTLDAWRNLFDRATATPPSDQP